MMNVEVKGLDGYKANRWTKEINGRTVDNIYIDSPSGEKLGHYDLIKRTFIIKESAPETLGILKDDEKDEAKAIIALPGADPVFVGVREVIIKNTADSIKVGQGSNLVKDFLVATGAVNDLTQEQFLTACVEGGVEYLRLFNQIVDASD